MKEISTHIYHSESDQILEFDNAPLVVIADRIPIEYVIAVTKRPHLSIVPFPGKNNHQASVSAVMVRGYTPKVGVVYRREESPDFFAWAVENNFAPIVLAPHQRMTAMQQLLEVQTLGYLSKGTWIHLAGHGADVTESSFPGVIFTWELSLWNHLTI